MGQKDIRRKRSSSSLLLSISLILSLLVAPLCAFRCSATTCARTAADPPADACHHHTPVLPSRGSALTPAFHQACPAAELFFTAPRAEEFSAFSAAVALSVVAPRRHAAARSVQLASPATAWSSLLAGTLCSIALRI